MEFGYDFDNQDQMFPEEYCWDCDGEGEVYFEDAGWGMCPACGGTGYA